MPMAWMLGARLLFSMRAPAALGLGGGFGGLSCSSDVFTGIINSSGVEAPTPQLPMICVRAMAKHAERPK
jgi:hypothetical protein